MPLCHPVNLSGPLVWVDLTSWLDYVCRLSTHTCHFEKKQKRIYYFHTHGWHLDARGNNKGPTVAKSQTHAVHTMRIFWFDQCREHVWATRQRSATCCHSRREITLMAAFSLAQSLNFPLRSSPPSVSLLNLNRTSSPLFTALTGQQSSLPPPPSLHLWIHFSCVCHTWHGDTRLFPSRSCCNEGRLTGCAVT